MARDKRRTWNAPDPHAPITTYQSLSYLKNWNIPSVSAVVRLINEVKAPRTEVQHD
jgi:hypothetical protein